MRQNSFQKNGLLNMKNANHNTSFIQDPNKLGRRSIEDIQNDMLNAKQRKFNRSSNGLETQSGSNMNNNQNNMQQRIDYLKRVDNINRWK